MRIFFTLFLIPILAGCAFGQKVDYSGISNFYMPPQEKKIIVAVHDMRPYVQDGSKHPDYAGTQRSLNGIPYNINTKSGNPLADDFGKLIVNTMEFRKVPATQQLVPYSWTVDDFKQKVLGKEKDSQVFYIQMAEWKTEAYMNVEIDYNLSLLVFNDQGDEVSSSQEKGLFNFDKSQHGRENLASATSNILENLFAAKGSTLPVIATPNKDKAEVSLFTSVPQEAKDDIKKKCSKDFPDDFAMQADCASKQSAGWRRLNN